MAYTVEQVREEVKTQCGITTTDHDRLLLSMANLAKTELLSWRFSYAPDLMPADGEVPDDLVGVWISSVVAGYSIAGAENQTAHSENGVSRTFKYSDIVNYIRRNVIPYAGSI